MAEVIRKFAEAAPQVAEPEKPIWARGKVKGLVGEVAEYIYVRSRYPSWLFSLMAAFAVVGTICARRIEGPTKSATHLYFLMLAATGAGKGDPIKLAKRLLYGVDPKLVGPGKLVSGAGLRKFLAQCPSPSFWLDEIQDQMNLATNKMNPHTSDILGDLKKYHTSYDQDVTETTVERDSVRIMAAHPTLFMTGTPEGFYQMIHRPEYTGGFMNRLVVGPVEDDLPEKESDEVILDTSRPDELIERLKALLPKVSILQRPIGKPKKGIRGQAGETEEVLDGEWLPDPHPIEWDSKAAEDLWKGFRDEMNTERRSSDFNRQHLNQRVSENAIRIATTHAVGRDGIKAKVTVEDMELGIALMRLSFKTACAQSEKHNAIKFDMPDMCEEIMAFMAFEGEYDKKPKKAGECTQAMLSRRFRKNLTGRFSMLDVALKHLIDEGRLIFELLDTGGARQTKLWKVVK
jgi:hypothetical protein